MSLVLLGRVGALVVVESLVEELHDIYYVFMPLDMFWSHFMHILSVPAATAGTSIVDNIGGTFMSISV